MMRICRRSRNLVLLTAFVTLSACSGAGDRRDSRHDPAAERAARDLAETEAQTVMARIQDNADPRLDAQQAIARQDYRLLAMVGMGGDGVPTGVTCFTPSSKTPRVLASYFFGDVINAKAAKFEKYAAVYNRLLIDSPAYPDADICRSADSVADKALDRNMLVRLPARTVARPPQSLHEAARRGTRAEVKRFIRGNLNEADGTGMTPLAWAVVRKNAQAIAVLVEACADPWIGSETRTSAVYWSAMLGEVGQFERLAAMGERPFKTWPTTYLAAAAKGESQILGRILAEPHEQFRIENLTSPLPSSGVLEQVLIDDRTRADSLLAQATGTQWGRRLRPDLVALALRYGANPNAEAYASRTVLGEIASGLDPASPEVVDLLLKAGADPNKLSWIDRPVWQPLGTIRLFPDKPELAARALAIYHRLHQAGADLNLLNGDGVPPIRVFFFPARYDHIDLESSAGNPAILEMLVRDGVDLNALWKGHRVLGLVESQKGRNSELAVTLRRLGAKP